MAVDITRLQRLVDRMEIQELVERFVVGLDQKSFDIDWARSIFTESGRFSFPNGVHSGVSGMPEFVTITMGRWRGSHHLAGVNLIAIDDDRARVRGNLIATHLHRDENREPFQVGDSYEGEVVRTEEGWRLAHLRFELIWFHGAPPGPSEPAISGDLEDSCEF
ncbi:nuclear transport factor 2 family protein [Rhodococcoides yunnanense]|uniref:Nuclear transport factor 2 family protein n=1 Tax=Rhodococcoides yunnanense TaxID=278209 RepID=A0ABU4BIM3_9NOCA|nr:nuclear transport factor 2 family protein [Rhodococcus yunnanensis]MDV6263936.1 nuclear transport factor 2 family protein [Rhodococcus yunnanensis]